MSGDEPKAIVSINIPFTYVSTGTNNIQDIIMLKTPRNLLVNGQAAETMPTTFKF